ncbi:MAG: AMP-binding protein [Treponemataceae bacterium]
MKTVIALLHEGARKYGSMPYLGQKYSDVYSTTSFAETDELSSAFAVSLVRGGFKKGENVAILAEGRASWVIGEFGLLKAGCSSVPLSTKLSPEEILFRLNHSEAKGILVSENNFSKVVEVLGSAQKKPLVICISERTSTFDQAIAKSGLKETTDLFFFDDMVAEGKAALRGKDGKSISAEMGAIEAAIDTDDTVTISYTSGTTGNPKGIMLTHRNYLHNAIESAKVVAIDKGWKSLIMLPLDHSFAHTVGIYIFLLNGVCMYFVDGRGGPLASLRNLPKNLVETNPDFLLTVPALSGNFMKKMIQGVAAKGPFINGIFERGVKAGIARAGNGFNKPSLWIRAKNFFPWALADALVFPKLRPIFGKDIKFCVGGGALLEIKQQEFFNAIGVPVYQGYGLTENAPIICSNSALRHKFGTSGVIIPNLEVKIMKDENTECKVGEIGQIVTKGGSVMKGYYKNPQATADTIKGDRLWSGDLGYIDADGFLVVTGREKALLIAADGEKYSPETIEEAVVNTSVFVNQIMAYNEQRKFTSALVTLNAEAVKAALKGREVGADEVIAMIRDDLNAFVVHPDYSAIPVQWRPASFAIISEAFDEKDGLINSTMKLVRHKVRDFHKERIEELYASGSADPLTAGNLAAVKALGLAAK